MRLPLGTNWFGLAGGIATFVLVAVSVFVPWWQLRIGDVGEPVVAANVSPIYANFDMLGNSFTLPLLFAINLSCVLLSIIGGILILIYSINPTKPYAKKLLTFSFGTPLFFIIIFAVALLVLTLVVRSMFSISIPLLGSAVVTLPSNTTQGMGVSVLLNAGFQWPFYLAVVAAVLCVGARLYHKRVLPPTSPAAPAIVIPRTSHYAPKA